jgi:hypothetical protein
LGVSESAYPSVRTWGCQNFGGRRSQGRQLGRFLAAPLMRRLRTAYALPMRRPCAPTSPYASPCAPLNSYASHAPRQAPRLDLRAPRAPDGPPLLDIRATQLVIVRNAKMAGKDAPWWARWRPEDMMHANIQRWRLSRETGNWRPIPRGGLAFAPFGRSGASQYRSHRRVLPNVRR